MYFLAYNERTDFRTSVRQHFDQPLYSPLVHPLLLPRVGFHLARKLKTLEVWKQKIDPNAQ